VPTFYEAIKIDFLTMDLDKVVKSRLGDDAIPRGAGLSGVEEASKQLVAHLFDLPWLRQNFLRCRQS